MKYRIIECTRKGEIWYEIEEKQSFPFGFFRWEPATGDFGYYLPTFHNKEEAERKVNELTLKQVKPKRKIIYP